MKNQRLISILIFLVIILLSKQFVLPQWQELTATSDKRDAAQKELSYYREIEAKLSTKKLNTPEVMEKIGKLNLILPKSFNEDLYIEEISYLASANGLILENIDVDLDQDINFKETRRVIINLLLTGSYDDFNRFLVSVKDNLTLFEVSELSITQGGTKEAVRGNNFEFKLKILTHISI